MKKKLYNYLILILFFVSCNKGPNLIIPTIEVDYLNKSEKMLKSECYDIDLIGARNIIVKDSLLIIIRENPLHQMIVYSSNTLDSLGGFCTRGRAGNEFIELSTETEQAYIDNNHVIIPLNNLMEEVKEVDVTESLKQNKTVIRNKTEILDFLNTFTLFVDNDLDNRFLFERNIFEGVRRPAEFNRVMTRVSLQKDNKKPKEIKLFRRLVDVEDIQFIYYPNSVIPKKHPSKNLIVLSYLHMDYLMFFDIDNQKQFAIHQEGTKTFDDVISYNTYDYITFGPLAASSDYIFVSYYQGKYSKEFDTGNVDIMCPELLIFDWNGNFVKSFKADRPMGRMSFDETHKKIYFMSADDNLYAYDLSEELP